MVLNRSYRTYWTYFLSLNMNRLSMHPFGGFHDCFRDGRMRVHRVAQLFGRRLELHGDASFGNQFSRVRTDDVYAQDLVVLRFADDLYKAFFFTEDARLARSTEGKL